MASPEGTYAGGMMIGYLPIVLAPEYMAPTPWEGSDGSLEESAPAGSISNSDAESFSERDMEIRATLQRVRETDTWFPYAEGVWLRSSPMELLGQFYFGSPDAFRSLSSSHFQGLSVKMKADFLVCLPDQGAAYAFRSGRCEEMTIDAGLRTLRSFPAMVGVLMMGGEFSHLEVAYQLDNKKETRSPRQTFCWVVLGWGDSFKRRRSAPRRWRFTSWGIF